MNILNTLWCVFICFAVLGFKSNTLNKPHTALLHGATHNPLNQQFSMCGSLLLWGQMILIQGHLRSLKNPDINITICNSSKITYNYEVATKITLWLGVSTRWGAVLQGHGIGKVENHCLKWFSLGSTTRKSLLTIKPSLFYFHCFLFVVYMFVFVCLRGSFSA